MELLAFYLGRFLKYPVKDTEALIQEIDKNLKGTWLSPISKFDKLKNQFSEKILFDLCESKICLFHIHAKSRKCCLQFFKNKTTNSSINHHLTYAQNLTLVVCSKQLESRYFKYYF
jgi:hypothetical protein